MVYRLLQNNGWLVRICTKYLALSSRVTVARFTTGYAMTYGGETAPISYPISLTANNNQVVIHYSGETNHIHIVDNSCQREMFTVSG